jgi:superfamily II DNA helicase RecQ
MTDHAIAVLNIVKEVIDNLGNNSLTLIKLASLYSGSKSKDIAKFSTLKNLPPAAGNLSKDAAENMLMQMVLKDYLYERHVVSGMGFGSEYVELGKNSNQLLRGNIRFTISSAGKEAKSTRQKKDKKATGDELFQSYPNDVIDEEEMFNENNSSAKNVAPKQNSKKQTKPSPPKKRPTSLVVIDESDNSDIIDDDDVEFFHTKPKKPKTKKSSQPRKSIAESMTEISDDEDQRKFEEKVNAEKSEITSQDITSKLSKKQLNKFQAWLEAYREQWTNWWHILTADAVADIIQKVPVTLEALKECATMNYNKVNKLGDEILATIYAFLEEHDLLHLFPQAIAPKIPESAIWKNPLSEEAKQIRLNINKNQNNSMQNDQAESPYFLQSTSNVQSSTPHHLYSNVTSPLYQSPIDNKTVGNNNNSGNKIVGIAIPYQEEMKKLGGIKRPLEDYQGK